MQIEKVLVAGIDVGKKGGIAFINKDTMEAEVFAMPEDFQEVIKIFSERKDRILLTFIEKQQAFPGQGVVSIFTLGFEYGRLIGMLKTLKIPYEEVNARKWQKVMIGENSKRSKKEIKMCSLEKAKSLFPYLDIGKHDGKSDALLIAEYGRRILISK